MKNLLLFVLSLLLTLPYTAKGQSYTISGTINGFDLNGEKVELVKLEDKTATPVQDATIKNNTFKFNGSIENPQLWMLLVENHRIPFVVENAEIYVQIFQDSTRISGTKINNDFQEFIDKSNTYRRQITELFPRYQAAPENSVEKKRLQDQYEKMEKEWQAQVVKFAEDNINNPAGQNALQSIYTRLSISELEYIIAKVDFDNLQNPSIQKVIKRVETLEKTAVGQFYTDIQAQNQSGKRIALSDYAVKNKYILLHFWASWCSPCRKGMPELSAIYSKYKKHGFEIVSFGMERTKNEWLSAIEELDMIWPQLSDLSYWDSNIVKTYDVTAIPYIILIDKEGVIIAKDLLPVEIENLLNDLLL